MRYTLALAESADFEATSDAPFVLGGVLVPHASAPEKKAESLPAAIDAINGAAGRWIFVVGRSPQKSEAPLASYLGFVRAIASVSFRFARALGAKELDVQARARKSIHADVRETIDAAKLVALTTLEVVAGSSTPCLSFADAGCTTLFQSPSGGYDGLIQPWISQKSNAPWIVRLDDIEAFNRIDDALGAGHLVETNELIERLRSDALATAHASRVASYRAADDLLRLRLDAFARDPSSHHSLGTLLAADAHGRLELRNGSYEGTWRALAQGWFSNKNPLALAMREKLTDRQRRARLYRLVAECANHRGDVVNAERASAGFESELSHGVSLSLLADTLVVRNLRVVAAQHQLPASAETLEAVTDRLTKATELLEKTVEQSRTLVSLASSLVKGTTSELPAEENELWTLLGRPVPEAVIADRELGRSLGTVARSFAFLGRHDDAVRVGLAARSHLQGDSFDLRINANILGRIILEACRNGTAAENKPVVAKLLRLAGASDLIDAPKVIDHLSSAPALRFAIDLLLRAILWCPDAVDAPLKQAWMLDIAKGAESELYKVLSVGELRTHPTELLGRHAGEACTDEAAKRSWLGLSRELSHAAGPDSTSRRFIPFTKALLEGASAAGNPGSTTNPTFEYR